MKSLSFIFIFTINLLIPIFDLILKVPYFCASTTYECKEFFLSFFLISSEKSRCDLFNDWVWIELFVFLGWRCCIHKNCRRKQHLNLQVELDIIYYQAKGPLKLYIRNLDRSTFLLLPSLLQDSQDNLSPSLLNCVRLP